MVRTTPSPDHAGKKGEEKIYRKVEEVKEGEGRGEEAQSGVEGWAGFQGERKENC
jgi:hypothetical protein